MGPLLIGQACLGAGCLSMLEGTKEGEKVPTGWGRRKRLRLLCSWGAPRSAAQKQRRSAWRDPGARNAHATIANRDQLKRRSASFFPKRWAERLRRAISRSLVAVL